MNRTVIEYGLISGAKARASGAREAQIASRKVEMDKFAVMYKNPLYNSALTFMEPLPVGLIIAFVSAGVLSRRQKRAAGGNLVADPSGIPS